jgi:hypothetical protein
MLGLRGLVYFGADYCKQQLLHDIISYQNKNPTRSNARARLLVFT